MDFYSSVLNFDAFSRVVLESWNILQESVVYIFIGFLVAGLLKAFLPTDLVNRHLGGNNFQSIIKASLLGIPLPL